MALTIVVGTITITANPLAIVDPVVSQPATAALTYTTFDESIVKSDLAATVFDAFPEVATIDTPATSKSKWPPGYANIVPPWGRPDDTGPTGTGYPEVKCEDVLPNIKRWTKGVNRAAVSRKSYLETFANTAISIATGIKSAIEDNFKAGRVTLTGASTLVSATFTANSEILFTRRTDGGAPGALKVGAITPGAPGTFEIISSNGGDNGIVSWFIAGK